MRIISKFRDYYDIGLSFGVDPKLVYLREQKEYAFRKATEKNPDWIQKLMTDPDFKKLQQSPGIPWRWWREEHSFFENLELVVVLFCGRVYPVFTYLDRKTYRTSYLHTIFDVDLVVNGSNDKKMQDAYFKKDGYRDSFTKFFARYEEFNVQRRALIEETHVATKAPIIEVHASKFIRGQGYGTTKIVVNPILKELAFQRILDPYTAFQELSMFMSNVIGIQAPETVEVSDEVKAAKHGYNDQSFRHPVKIPHRKGGK